MAGQPTFYLSFGLLTIPVKSSPAAREARMDFTQLHGPCVEQGAAAKMSLKYVCQACHQDVKADDKVKGVEVGKGSFVTVTPAELEGLEIESSRTMAIQAFVPRDAVDPVYLGASNHLTPADQSAAKAFGLLRAAMAKTTRSALVLYVQSHREKLGLLRVAPDGLLLFELFYEKEIRPSPSGGAEPELQEPEMKLAVRLVKTMERPLDLSGYEDGYQARLAALVAAKQAGTLAPVTTKRPEPATVINLMDALKKSLDAAAPAA